MLVPPLEQPPPSWSPLNPGQISAEAIIEAHKRQQLQQLPSSSFIPIKPLTKSGKPRRTFKVILIGDAGVGKTCLSFRFCNGRFPENTEATIGVDFRERTFEIDGELIRVQLWDTAGQERYRSAMMATYYRNVDAIVFVYDVTNRQSFTDLAHWIGECQKHDAAVADAPRLLIGNKCDCTPAAVSTDEATRYADTHGMPLFETSAKADSQAEHVDAILMTLVHKLREHKPMSVRSTADAVQLPTTGDVTATTPQSSGCSCF